MDRVKEERGRVQCNKYVTPPGFNLNPRVKLPHSINGVHGMR